MARPVAVALWIAHTYSHDVFAHTPRLAILSPEKRCGKTTLLSVLDGLCQRPLEAANVSAAALFRVVGVARPTLLIDEADTFLNERSELHGILNSGNRRGGAVLRCDGDSNEVRQFPCFAPVAIAAIGALPSTLMDRSVILRMRRRLARERLAKLGPRFDDDVEPLRKRLARFVADSRAIWAVAEPMMPAGLNDRAEDNWRPLLAIADIAGAEWGARARVACELLSGSSEDEEDSTRTRLLHDVRVILAAYGESSIPVSILAERLAGDETSPWAAYGRSEKPIRANTLAKLLSPFGIRAYVKKMLTGRTAKVFDAADFADAFERYLEPPK